jgi:hypothetical protein
MKRTLLVIAGAILLVVVGWASLIGAALAWSGVAVVSVVEDNGPRIVLPVPMAALEAVSVVVDLGNHAEMRMEQWTPVARQLLESLEECPDVVLVEVVDHRDRVRVEKRGGSLLIRVEDGSTDVQITLPTRSARRAVARLVS